MQCKYSIIIPHYNSSKSLENLLETIPDSHYFEVVVVDDYSSSDHWKKLVELASSRDIKLLSNSGVKSAGACRNIGIENSQGEWIIFADSDDLFLPNFMFIVEKYYHSTDEIIYFKPESKSLVGHDTIRHKYYVELIDNYNDKGDDSLKYKYYVPWSKMIRRKLVKRAEIRFDEIIASNDLNFSLEVGIHARSVFGSCDSIYCVTESGNSLTSFLTAEKARARIDAAIRYNSILETNDLMRFQMSIVGFVTSYWKYLSVEDILYLSRKALLNQWKVFPSKYM